MQRFVLRVRHRLTIIESRAIRRRLNLFVMINSMFGTLISIRKNLALCLALCMPCQAMHAAHCVCTSDCCCQYEGAEYGERVIQCNCSCCSGSVCCSPDDDQSQGQPCHCECHEIPLYGLPLSQLTSCSLSESLLGGVGLLACATSNGLDLSRQQTFVDTQNTSCTVQQPCIFFCRFLL